MANITVLGMGSMGTRMATALIETGHTVTVWNRTVEKTAPLVALGAKASETPRQAVSEADFVISMVRDDQASRQVWLDVDAGALAGLKAGAVAIESSTLTVDWVKELSQYFQSAGVSFLDAPVAGSRPQAEARQLIYFVGGEADTVAKVEPILQNMGGAVHHAGPVGSGMAIKLVVNALFGIQAAALGELLPLLEGCGLDPAQAMEIIATTPVCSPAAKVLAGAMNAAKFAPLFPIELVEKDFGYVEATAQSIGAQVPVVKAIQDILKQAIDQGYGADNITGIVQVYR